MRGNKKMYSFGRLLVVAVSLIALFSPAGALAQANFYQCTNCNVYDITNPNPAPNNAVLSLHYYCDNTTNERAEIFYARAATEPVLGYLTSNDQFILKGRVTSAYVHFYNAASTNSENNGVGTDPYSSLSTSCKSKLQAAQVTSASGFLSHSLTVDFRYLAGLTVFSRDSHGIATYFQVRSHGGAANSGTATGANVIVNGQEKFNMASPPYSFYFQVTTAPYFAQGWLMGTTNANCPRLSGGASTSDWLFLPVFKKYVTQCNDGIDNDGDGKVDHPQDGGCSSPTDPTETAQCSDGVDNDADGATDYPADFSCSGPDDDDETNPKAQCQDGLDNDGDGKIDFPTDPGCTSKQDNSETDTTPPAAPINVQASDGTQVRRIDVTWTPSTGATSYTLYRSVDQNAFNDPNFAGVIANGLTGTSYIDTDPTIEPGQKYYYSVKASNSFGSSGFAVPDSGFALCSPGHCDCDDNSDAVEREDGTNECDGGDFVLHLKSPAFTKYNTFLTQSNFLELVASGTKDMSILVTVYRIDGSVKAQTTVPLTAGTEFDVDINTLVGQKDTYGLVRIDFDDQTPGSSLLGRISNYRLDPGASTYSFAFTKELRNTTTGQVYVATNSIDPQGQGFLVPNWLEVMNVEDTIQQFNYRLYAQDGRLLTTKFVNLQPRGEIDIQAGHENGQGVYLAELVPVNPSAKYFATVSRYSSNAFGGNEANTYNFAFSVEARKGTGSPMFAPTTNKTGATWVQTNWIEVANTRDTSVPILVEFRNANGNMISSQPMNLAPKAQFHFNAGALLGTNGATAGSVRVTSTTINSLITTSMVYFHDKGNFLQTGYISLARIAGPSKQIGSVNSFIQIRNELTLLNASTQPFTATIDVQPFGLPAQATATVNFGASAASVSTFSNFPADHYGVVKVAAPNYGLVAGETLRIREIGGKVDFAFPTAVQ